MIVKIILNFIIVYFCINHISSIIVRNYHDNCLNNDECVDHRQICEEVNTSGLKLCVCDPIHEWVTDLQACVPKFNSTYLLKNIYKKRHNTTEWIAGEADKIFYGTLLAGLVVIFVGTLCFLSVLLYCTHMHNRDRSLKNIVKTLKEGQDIGTSPARQTQGSNRIV